MKVPVSVALGLLGGLLCYNVPLLASMPTAENPPPGLTVELRDGSRVLGISVDRSFKFHSSLLGDLKLKVNDICVVECVSSNSAKLTTVNGDTLTVWFAGASIAVETSFGKVALPVTSIRRLAVSATGAAAAHLPGLVAFWSGAGGGTDAVGGKHRDTDGRYIRTGRIRTSLFL